jgi:hypothetical protein
VRLPQEPHPKLRREPHSALLGLGLSLLLRLKKSKCLGLSPLLLRLRRSKPLGLGPLFLRLLKKSKMFHRSRMSGKPPLSRLHRSSQASSRQHLLL